SKSRAAPASALLRACTAHRSADYCLTVSCLELEGLLAACLSAAVLAAGLASGLGCGFAATAGLVSALVSGLASGIAVSGAGSVLAGEVKLMVVGASVAAGSARRARL